MLPSQALPFSIDDVLVQIYYYLDKSSKRLGKLEKVQVEENVEHKNIIKHCPTRWLSLSTCLDRLIENWDALKTFFKNELGSTASISKSRKDDDSTVPKEKVPDKMLKFLQSPTNRLYCLFLQYAIKPFIITNLKLQEEAPQIHILQRTIRTLLNDVLCRLVAPWAMNGKLYWKLSIQPQ